MNSKYLHYLSMKKIFTLFSLIVLLLIPSVAWAHDPAGSAGMGGGILADFLAIPTIIFLVIFYHKKKKRPEHISPVIGFIVLNYILYAILFISCLRDGRAMSVFCLFGFPSFSIFIVHFCLHAKYKDHLKAMQSGDMAETPPCPSEVRDESEDQRSHAKNTEES